MYDGLSDRRTFLATLASMGGALLLRRRGTEIKVQATPTVFFAQPDGRNALVRFVVEGSTAPAGRLRVYDGTHKQLLASAPGYARLVEAYSESEVAV